MDTTVWGCKCWDLDLEHEPEPKSEIYMPCLICTHYLMEMKDVPSPERLEFVYITVSVAVAVILLLI